MNKMENDSVLIGKKLKIIEQTRKYVKYEFLPEYGNGTMSFYYLLPQVCIYVNDVSANNDILENLGDSSQYCSGEMFKMDYCISGKMLCADDVGKTGIVKSGNTSYYYGNKNWNTLKLLEKRYKAVGITGYSDEIIKVLVDIMGVDKSIFIHLFEKVNSYDTYVSVASSYPVVKIVQKILGAANRKDFETMKVKALEWILYEARNIDENLKEKESTL